MNFLSKLFGKKDTKAAAETAPPVATDEPPASVHLLESVQAPVDPPASDSQVDAAPEQASGGE